jgi:hypothetical protein
LTIESDATLPPVRGDRRALTAAAAFSRDGHDWAECFPGLGRSRQH